MTRKPRRLTPEERELWAHVAASAQPFHASPKRVADVTDPPKPKKKPRPEVTDFRVGQSAPDYAFRHDLAPSISERLAHAPVRMDRKTHRIMTRGKLRPEARIDLHGRTLGQAHPDLIRFITGSYAQGLRLVLVITGKGKRGLDDGPIPQRQGALRHQVPQWLGLPPLGGMVLQVAEAHLSHGGSGALYVYLRRSG